MSEHTTAEIIGRPPTFVAGMWISVADKLPEEGAVILAAWRLESELRGTEAGVFQARYEGGKWLDLTDYDGQPIETNYVTHWMPLPEPPEVEGK